jgi:hypothetical protein
VKRRVAKEAPFALPADVQLDRRSQAELTSNVVWVVQWLKKTRGKWDWATAHKGPSEGAAKSVYRGIVADLKAGTCPHARLGVGYADGIGAYVWVSTAKVRDAKKGRRA